MNIVIKTIQHLRLVRLFIKGRPYDFNLQRGKPRSRHRACLKAGGGWGAAPPAPQADSCENVDPIDLKSFQDPSKNPSKIIPKSFQIVVAIMQIEVWRGSGAAVGRVFAPRRM